MKKIILMMVMIFSAGFAWANRMKPVTTSYILVGQCSAIDGQIYGDDPSSSGHVVLPNIDYAGVGTGPTDDGYGGCQKYVELMSCESRIGRFVIDDGNNGMFHMPPTVSSFTCVE